LFCNAAERDRRENKKCKTCKKLQKLCDNQVYLRGDGVLLEMVGGPIAGHAERR